ncbi:hypothetical protein HDU98_004933 [Podochytrium sp. JEL0797]|nr:hypothetical protein HDU98_004933 [Podochytrium sp. JEL0797]
MRHAFPVLGASLSFVINVSLQLVAALILDNYGWVGIPKSAATTGAIVGICVVLVGVFVIGFAPTPPSRAATSPPPPTESEHDEEHTPPTPIVEKPKIEIDEDSEVQARRPKFVFIACLIYTFFSGIVRTLQGGMNTALGVGYASSSFSSMVAASIGIPPCLIAFAIERSSLKVNFKTAIKGEPNGGAGQAES